MRRHSCVPRPDWVSIVEGLGLLHHSHDQGPYWDESACYELSAREVDLLESAANEVYARCLEAAQRALDQPHWDTLGIPAGLADWIRQSWDRDDFSLYGRFDFAWNGTGAPKLLEFNADTPTALLEASVIQWQWLETTRRGADQFNSIHERLIEAWRKSGAFDAHFSCLRDHLEDLQTTQYLQDTAHQAGLATTFLPLDDIGWDPRRQRFLDLENKAIATCFKLYPWEWLTTEAFAEFLPQAPTRWVEPPWKWLLSGKGLLPLLWEMFPSHPHLLPAFAHDRHGLRDFVRKPRWGREGANITVHRGGQVTESSPGNYADQGFIDQALAPMARFGDAHPVFGVWIIDHQAAGLGIREDTSPITTNLSRFVPHFFR